MAADPEALPFAEIPMWITAIGIVVSLFAAYLGACWLRRFRSVRDEDALTADGYIVTAVLGLLALLVGFTFALAVDRFDIRRLLVLDEANAIRAAFLRAQTFEDPHRVRLSRLLGHYVDNRLALGAASDHDEINRLMANDGRLHVAMWQATLQAVASRRDDVSASYMDSMSEVIEIGASRRTAREAHVPARVFVVLLIYMVASAAVLGFAIGPKRWRTASILFLLVTMSYLLIFDIDEPVGGGVRESQQPMEALKASIDRARRVGVEFEQPGA